MFLIAGLGNPGEDYRFNRHNVGFMAVDYLHRFFSFGSWKKNFQGEYSEGQIDQEKVLLLKPQTFMNRSGFSVAAICQFYKILPEQVIVLHDDMAVDAGKIKVKLGGGHGGHNGLKSLDAQISPNYIRIRIGIGHPGDKNLVTNFVLSNFKKTDGVWLEECFEAISEALPVLIEQGVDRFLIELHRLLQQKRS